MTTVRAMAAHARTSPTGRAALAAIWLGLLIATAGLWQLHVELSRHPLDAARIVCWPCTAGHHHACTGHCDCCG